MTDKPVASTRDIRDAFVADLAVRGPASPATREQVEAVLVVIDRHLYQIEQAGAALEASSKHKQQRVAYAQLIQRRARGLRSLFEQQGHALFPTPVGTI